MKKVIIIGGGFAGMGAVKKFAALRRKLDITVVDRDGIAHFLPLLPDIIGRQIPPASVMCDIETLCVRCGIRFLQDEATSVDCGSKAVRLTRATLSYDYLLLAVGTETNFFGNTQIQEHAYKIDSTFDANSIIRALERGTYVTCIVAGGGYTGIEIATGIRRYAQVFYPGRYLRILVVERAASILGPLPAWMKRHVSQNLQRLQVAVLTDTTIETINRDTVVLSDGKRYNRAMLIWAAGVKTGSCIDSLDATKNRQGRLHVDEYLRINSSCFAAGDNGVFVDHDVPLRMAVQFAILQGRHCAENIVRDIESKPLKPYRALDLGYIIPLANNNSCGKVLGVPIRGFVATLMHYLMCIYRTETVSNKIRLIGGLLQRGVGMKEWATIPLRIAFGIIFIAHGLQKAFGLFGGSGIEGFAKALTGMGFAPASLLAYVVAYTELVGGVCVLIGLGTRIASVFIAIVMAVAICKAHWSGGLFAQNGGFEYPLALLLCCIALMLSGGGKFSITKRL